MPTIEDYSFGRIVIDGVEHTRDVIVLPDGVVANWWRREGHSLVVEDLEAVLDRLPARLIVGTGAYGRMQPQRSALDALERRGVQVEVCDTEEAVRRYRAADPSATAGALHLTC